MRGVVANHRSAPQPIVYPSQEFSTTLDAPAHPVDPIPAINTTDTDRVLDADVAYRRHGSLRGMPPVHFGGSVGWGALARIQSCASPPLQRQFH